MMNDLIAASSHLIRPVMNMHDQQKKKTILHQGPGLYKAFRFYKTRTLPNIVKHADNQNVPLFSHCCILCNLLIINCSSNWLSHEIDVIY